MSSTWKRNTALFITSQLISQFGTSLVQCAITWYITLNTQSGLMMTLSILCGFVPTLLLSPFGGVWADRYNRKWLIILADSGIAVVTLALAVMFLLGYRALWPLFVISAVRALGTAVQQPAVNAFIPELVPEDKLMRVNGLLGSAQSLVMLVSPMVSGALLTLASIESIFFVDVATAALAVTVFMTLRVPARVRTAIPNALNGYMEDFRRGLSYVRSHPFLRRFFIYGALSMFMVAPVAFLTPLQVTRVFGGDVWRLTAIEVIFSLGMTAGGLAISAWGGFKNRIRTMALSSLIMGVFTMGLGFDPVFWMYLVFMAILASALPLYNTPATVLIQEKVEDAYRGRVFSVMNMMSSSMMPLGMLVFGPLADFVDIEWMLILTGAVLMLQGAVMVKDHMLLAAGDPLPVPAGHDIPGKTDAAAVSGIPPQESPRA